MRIIPFAYMKNQYTCFNVGSGFNFGTNSSIQTNSGDIIIGGTFTSYKGVTQNRIVKLLTNGTADTFSTTGFAGGSTVVRNVQQQSTGKIICAGAFTTYNGIDVSDSLCRLNLDGTPDLTFNSGGSGVNSTSEGFISSYVTSDDKIYISAMLSYNGSTKLGVLKLNSDGTVDNTWTCPTTGETSGSSISYTFQPQSSGKMIISASRYFNTNTKFLGRLNLDGTVDTTFNSGGAGFQMPTGGSPITDRIVVLSDDKILVANRCKSFGGTYNGTIVDFILRVNSDGSLDNTFATTGTGFNSTIQTIFVLPSNKILVSGLFGSYNGTTVRGIARLNSDGSLDTSFNSGGSGFNGFTSASNFTLLNDGNILVGGTFTSYNGVTVNRIIKISPDGVLLNC